MERNKANGGEKRATDAKQAIQVLTHPSILTITWLHSIVMHIRYPLIPGAIQALPHSRRPVPMEALSYSASAVANSRAKLLTEGHTGCQMRFIRGCGKVPYATRPAGWLCNFPLLADPLGVYFMIFFTWSSLRVRESRENCLSAPQFSAWAAAKHTDQVMLTSRRKRHPVAVPAWSVTFGCFNGR